jgi:hypothetical protein
MTSIDAVSGRAGPNRAGRARAAGSPGAFRVPDQPPPDAAVSGSAVGGSAPVAMDVLLAAEALDRHARNETTRRHGNELLRRLAALQRDLLGGADGSPALSALAVLVAATPPVEDPTLAGLLEAVLLRARVALAQHRR